MEGELETVPGCWDGLYAEGWNSGPCPWKVFLVRKGKPIARVGGRAMAEGRFLRMEVVGSGWEDVNFVEDNDGSGLPFVGWEDLR
jgi:hypothetical protein